MNIKESFVNFIVSVDPSKKNPKKRKEMKKAYAVMQNGVTLAKFSISLWNDFNMIVNAWGRHFKKDEFSMTPDEAFVLFYERKFLTQN